MKTERHSPFTPSTRLKALIIPATQSRQTGQWRSGKPGRAIRNIPEAAA